MVCFKGFCISRYYNIRSKQQCESESEELHLVVRLSIFLDTDSAANSCVAYYKIFFDNQVKCFRLKDVLELNYSENIFK